MQNAEGETSALATGSKALEVLACPKCKGGLTPHREGAGLDCGACGLWFRVENGIPILLVAQGQPLE